MRRSAAVAALAASVGGAMAQNCISLSGSTACPAFDSASISTDSTLVGYFPFLQYVSNVQDFDREINTYIRQGYVQFKYINIFGCSNVDLSNTTSYYARYTASYLCNGIVQNSRQPCGLSNQDSMPLCADSCAEFAQSEETIISSSQLCSPRSQDYSAELRADFTNCALPASSLTGDCIEGATNEPDNCGYSNNLVGLCDFCRGSTENATDSCCLTSNAEGRCRDVKLPVFSSVAQSFTLSPTSSASSSPSSSAAAASSGHHGLSGGAIAGIVIGSIFGFLLLLALIAGACILYRRRRNTSSNGSMLNQPSPQRKGVTAMSYQPPPSSSQQGYEVLPGGRVARMAALSGEEPRRNVTASTDPYQDSPASGEKAAGVLGAAKGSPGSDSNNDSSNEYSSPEGVASGQSEQLPFFRDYYSSDDIHPGDKVSVLWAYQPRAGDEFELERGDMLKVVGIWDDGWATGVRINDRAEDYEGKKQRDSGVSNGSEARQDSPPPPGEIKAFPLVCVCLPEAWKKTVEGDTSTESGSGGPPPT